MTQAKGFVAIHIGPLHWCLWFTAKRFSQL